MKSTFDLGPLTIHYYSICILLALIIGSFLVIKEGKKFNISKDTLFDLLFYVIIFGIIGARLYFVLYNLDYYLNNPLEILMIWHGGLAIHGGIIAGLITIIIYSKKKNLEIFRILDIIVPALIIGQAIGRWGNFFNGEAHGPVVSLNYLNELHLPNFIITGMNINGVYYEPTFLYESIWCIIGFIILILIRRMKNIRTGQILSIYLIWYSIGRFFIEILRTDSLMFIDLKIAQIVSIIMIICGIIIFIKSKKHNLYNLKGEKK